MSGNLSWKDITIGQFIEAWQVQQMQFDDELDRNLAMAAAITGNSASDLKQMGYDDLVQLFRDIQFVAYPEQMDKRFPKLFSIKGRMFRPTRKFNKLSAGQFIDLTSFIKKSDEIIPNLHKILATLCLPFRYGVRFQTSPRIRAKWFYWYDGAKHEQLSELLYDNLTMDIAYPIAVFFCNLWAGFTPHIVRYLETEMMSQTGMISREQTRNLETLLSRLTAGYTQSMSWQERTSLNGSS